MAKKSWKVKDDIGKFLFALVLVAAWLLGIFILSILQDCK